MWARQFRTGPQGRELVRGVDQGRPGASVSRRSAGGLLAGSPAGFPAEVPLSAIDIVPIILVFAVMYFLIIRPQIREKQDHEKLVSSLERGDKVVTAAGIHGTVANVLEETILLEVADKTRIVVDKSTVARRPGSKADAQKSAS